MFTQEEKAKAQYFKFSLHPQDELEDYLHPRFLPVIDKNHSENITDSVSVTIPKHIMVFWHDEIVPQDVRGSIEKIKLHNPKYQVEIFHTESAGAFIQQVYGTEIYDLYNRRCVHPSMKSDFFRMCYLAEKGGIYVDVDIDCFASLELIFNHYDADCFLFYTKGQPCCIDNDFIACQAKNPIILAILEKTKEHLTAKRSFSSVWECTGPGAVSMAILQLLMEDILQGSAHLNGLQLAPHSFALRAYGHAELEYKKTTDGNWRYFSFPRNLYQL